MAVSPITPWTIGGLSNADNMGGDSNNMPHHRHGGERSWSGNIFGGRIYDVERICARLRNSVHPKVRLLLPGPNEILQYPLHVITTRSSLSGLIPRAPQNKDGSPNSYVEIQLNAKTTSDPTTSSQLPPGRRWLKLASPAFVKIVEHAANKPGRVSISKIPDDIKPLSTCGAIKHLYRVYGFGGFYKGFLSSHNTNLINEGLATALTPPTKKLLQTVLAQSKLEGRETSQRETFLKRFFQWYQSEQGMLMSATFGASLLASTLTYPLSTINLRRIVYEPLDGIDVNFVDMARLTVLFDGPPSLFNGFGSYISAKLIQAIGTLCAQATASTLEAKVNSSPASVALLNQVKPALDVLTSPLTQYAQQSQALSRIPGLAYSKPSFRSALGNLLSPVSV